MFSFSFSFYPVSFRCNLGANRVVPRQELAQNANPILSCDAHHGVIIFPPHHHLSTVFSRPKELGHPCTSLHSYRTISSCIGLTNVILEMMAKMDVEFVWTVTFVNFLIQTKVPIRVQVLRMMG